MPPIPKAFPREECESVTLFFKSEYQDYCKKQNTGTTSTIARPKKKRGHRPHKSSSSISDNEEKDLSHFYLQYKDGTPTSKDNLQKLSEYIRSAWQSLPQSRHGPTTIWQDVLRGPQICCTLDTS